MTQPHPAGATPDGFRDNVERNRFELEVDGLVAFADYRRRDGTIVVTHVEAPIPLRGTGTADRLMRAVAETARAEGSSIRPLCGYAAGWLRAHREFRDLAV
ncbi:GNAT family N-acetyltransferase [Prosthecodimorpha staleyi]|uniref:N-acetyltransferase n=1 Tax=Prosthecodimorpha staleyi TaxID=2840188 RepID=A0A947DBL0_9HYPH|nr:GNAT family N-acetyltransferase [Prosthecodimorpha staleyi]MBT9292762.1 N-acetyltransferase [Prosthecodimorpha staleyi]